MCYFAYILYVCWYPMSKEAKGKPHCHTRPQEGWDDQSPYRRQPSAVHSFGDPHLAPRQYPGMPGRPRGPKWASSYETRGISRKKNQPKHLLSPHVLTFSNMFPTYSYMFPTCSYICPDVSAFYLFYIIPVLPCLIVLCFLCFIYRTNVGACRKL